MVLWWDRVEWFQDMEDFASASELLWILNFPFLTPLPPLVAKRVAQLYFRKRQVI